MRDSPPDPGPAGPGIRPCPNCAAPVDGRYCAWCGQRNASRLVSVRRMAAEVVEDELSLNGTLPRTLTGLLLRPGFLTREYLRGRIVRYLRPFRLYLVSSVIFFVALSWRVDAQGWIERELEPGRSAATPDSITGQPAEREAPESMNVTLVDDTSTAAPWFRPIARRLKEQEARLNAMRPEAALRQLMAGLERSAPKAVFLLVPAFALFLKLLYLRAGRLYVEHFVFALHVHAFAFALFTLMLVLPDRADGVLVLWLMVYLFWAMKRVYEQSLLMTAAKYLVLSTLYLTALTLVTMGVVMLALLTV